MQYVIVAVLNLLLLFLSQCVYANPHWDARLVPKDTNYASVPITESDVSKLKLVKNENGIDVIRVQVDWHEKSETYTVTKMIIEASGTPALLARSTHKPKLGSYLGQIKSNRTGEVLYYDSIGTGKEYRKLARAINLRFPLSNEDVTFELYAENPTSGAMELVASKQIIASQLQRIQNRDDELEVRELALAAKSPSIRINIYADGYLKNEKNEFWNHAVKTVQALQRENFPGIEYMSFYGVFHPSNKKLGSASDLGYPVPEYDSFLGLYYPYWDGFGRWYNIVYPTREDKFRQGLASAPYDYPIVLMNNSEYWGVGNYMSHTAIPAANSMNFTYLLIHEFGHFFGLNEEYEGGGRTELEFAAGIEEPWSQNITFLTDNRHEKLKWNTFVDKSVQLPTPGSVWRPAPPVYGAYVGGYADSTSTRGKSHKPGLNCAMDRYKNFCDICKQAITDVVHYGIGE